MKSRLLTTAMFVLGMSVSTPSQAAAIGMPVQTAKFGVAVGFGTLSVDSPEGDSDREWAVRPLNLIYTDQINGPYRYWAEAFYQDAVISPSQTQIGQQVRQLGVRLSGQRTFARVELGEPSLGVGLQLSQDRYDKRHTIDADGYLAQTYADSSGFQSALLLNYVLETEIAGFDVAGKLEKTIPFGDGVDEFTASVVLLFSF